MNQSSFSTTPVTFTLIAINVAIALLFGNSAEFRSDWAVVNDVEGFPDIGVSAGEWWRVLTGTFLHAQGFTHILFNMYALYVLGPRLEQQVGSPAFAGLYLATAVGGSLASILLQETTVSVGASGAVFGLFGAWLWAGWRLRHTPGGRALLGQFGVLILINAALPLFVRNIDWRAHLGGLVLGIAIAATWSRFAARRPNARAIRAIVAYGLLALGLVIAMLI